MKLAECIIHKDRPEECPQNHYCRHCGQALNQHGSGGHCRDGINHYFEPDAETLAMWSRQYDPALAG